MKIIALSEANILSIHSIALISAAGEGGISAKRIADLTKGSKHHLFKVLEVLTKAGFLYATRGPSGGFYLKKPADQILLIDIFEALNGKVNEEELCYGKDRSALNNVIFDNMCANLSKKFIDYLRKTKVSDLTEKALKLLNE